MKLTFSLSVCLYEQFECITWKFATEVAWETSFKFWSRRTFYLLFVVVSVVAIVKIMAKLFRALSTFPGEGQIKIDELWPSVDLRENFVQMIAERWNSNSFIILYIFFHHSIRQLGFTEKLLLFLSSWESCSFGISLHWFCKISKYVLKWVFCFFTLDIPENWCYLFSRNDDRGGKGRACPPTTKIIMYKHFSLNVWLRSENG